MSDEQDPLQTAVDKLSDAATIPELIAVHREIRRKIRAARRKHKGDFGPLATAYGEMMTLADSMKADGATVEQRNVGIENVLRELWPFSREWKYVCNECRDTGAVNRICRVHQRCNGLSTRADSPFQPAGKFQRLCTKSDTYEHEYVTPCFCSLGARLREKPRHDPSTFGDSGKTGRPTRLGRRS